MANTKKYSLEFFLRVMQGDIDVMNDDIECYAFTSYTFDQDTMRSLALVEAAATNLGGSDMGTPSYTKNEKGNGYLFIFPDWTLTAVSAPILNIKNFLVVDNSITYSGSAVVLYNLKLSNVTSLAISQSTVYAGPTIDLY